VDQESDFVLSSDEITLSSNRISECIISTFNGTRECSNDQKNITIMAEWRESKENNVTFYRQEATIIITQNKSKLDLPGIIIHTCQPPCSGFPGHDAW
jgi:hypothetical protein